MLGEGRIEGDPVAFGLGLGQGAVDIPEQRAQGGHADSATSGNSSACRAPKSATTRSAPACATGTPPL